MIQLFVIIGSKKKNYLFYMKIHLLFYPTFTLLFNHFPTNKIRWEEEYILFKIKMKDGRSLILFFFND